MNVFNDFLFGFLIEYLFNLDTFPIKNGFEKVQLKTKVRNDFIHNSHLSARRNFIFSIVDLRKSGETKRFYNWLENSEVFQHCNMAKRTKRLCMRNETNKKHYKWQNITFSNKIEKL